MLREFHFPGKDEGGNYRCDSKVCFSSLKCSIQPSPQLHHSRTPLPSNGEAGSRHAKYNRDAADRIRGRGGGGRSVDISPASNSQHSTADMITYRTHGIQRGDIKMLSTQTAEACTVQEKKNTSSQPTSPGGADQDNINLRSDQITSV